MRYSTRIGILGLAALWATACSDYLSAPGVATDPNNVTRLTRPGPLYVAMQPALAMQYEGMLGRMAAMYTQQVAGNGRQHVGFDRGSMDPVTIDPNWISVYGSTRTLNGGGGLLDIHKMQQLARAVNDSIYLGIGKIYEVLAVGLAADIWGNIPYRQAADSNNQTPAFDPQLQVYADLQAQLDSAIVFLKAQPGGTNVGPTGPDNAELIYRGRDAAALAAVYTQVAHSLKARYYMHAAEVDPSSYARALAEVPLGINASANDMLLFHDQTPNGQNIWWQFHLSRGDVGPGAAMINLLKRRIAAGVEDSARLKLYFLPATAGTAPVGYFGYRPAGATGLVTAPGGDGGNGSPPGAAGAADSGGHYSEFNFANSNVDAGDLRMPVTTFAETQLIGAEAAFQTGGQGAAQPFLDAARADRAYGARGSVPVTLPALATVPATLQNVMEEKYVALFLSPEVWNDYRRTCLPSLASAPALGSDRPGASPIPGRLPYGLTETNANPHTPVVPPTGYNANDPNRCPVLDYSSSSPLAN
jgi:hypothetical protein